MRQKSLREKHLIQVVSGIIILFLIGYITSLSNAGIDLTQDKRFTLHKVSKQKLRNLPEGILVKVYLEGDMPLSFKRLRRSTQDMLDPFRLYSDDKLDYIFVDPFENPDPKERKKMMEVLYDKGLQPTNVKMKDDKGNQSEKMLVPGALVSFKNKEIPVALLTRNVGLSSEINLNNSIQSLEYNLLNAITGITLDSASNIAILEGHGELNDYQTADLSRELEMNLRYKVFRGTLTGSVHNLDPYKAVIIAKPQTPYEEEEKFIIDQYIMNGGKVIWLIDQVKMDLDSIAAGEAIALIRKTNLEDQLFRYGVRINPVLLQDAQCALIPVNIALASEQPRFVPAPFHYLPLFTPSENHVITKNLNLIRGEFANTIDTVGSNHDIKKTILLSSSLFSRTINAPVRVSLSEVKHKLQRADFKAPFSPVAILLEGSFESVFRNRMTDDLKLKEKVVPIEKGKPTKMVIIADGDLIKNNVYQTPQGIQIMPLGFDRYSNQTYGNKEFILNLLNYLTNEESILELRNREMKLRLLNKEKLKEEKLKWQLINLLNPAIMICLSGIIIFIYRRKRFL